MTNFQLALVDLVRACILVKSTNCKGGVAIDNQRFCYDKFIFYMPKWNNFLIKQ